MSDVIKTSVGKIKKRKRTRFADLPPLSVKEELIEGIARSLAKQIDKKVFEKKYASVKTVLTIVGVGAFLAASVAMPNLPLALKPFLSNEEEDEAWKRFNIPYLKRTLKRLAQQKLVEIEVEGKMQIIKITAAGRRKILKFAIDELTIEKPKSWDGTWRLVSYDIPSDLKHLRDAFRENLEVWEFYPLHESVYLHAYPCEKQVEFLREYLGIGQYVRIFKVTRIENDGLFREYFGV